MPTISQIETDDIYTISDPEFEKFKTTYNHKRYVLLTDSYGLPEGSGGTSWTQLLINTGKYDIARAYALDGGGFGSSTAPFSNNWESNLEEDGTVTDIIILAGANDGALLYEKNTTESNIINGIKNGFNVLKSKYPNGKIHLGFVGRHHYIHNTFKVACGLYAQYCGINGGAFIDNCQYILHSYQWIDDTDIHPTQEGSNRIFRYISSYLNGGDIDVEYTVNQLMTGTLFGLHMHVHNGVTTVTMYNHTNPDINSVPLNLNNYTLGNDYYNKINDFIFWDFTPENVTAITVGCYYTTVSDGETTFFSTFMLGFKYNVVTGTGMGNTNPVKTDVNKLVLGLGTITYDSMLC